MKRRGKRARKALSRLKTQASLLSVRRAIRRGDTPFVLNHIAKAEAKGASLALDVSLFITDKLLVEEGRSDIASGLSLALKHHPESAYLLFLDTLCRCYAGDFKNVGQGLLDRIANFRAKPEGSEGEIRRKHRLFTVLKSCWQIADQIAREQMDWACADPNGYQTYHFIHAVELPSTGKTLTFSFREMALQNKDYHVYLSVCDEEIAKATSVHQKLRIISDMLRQGVRRLPSYRDVYAHARQALEALRPEWEPVLNGDPSDLSAPPPRRTLSIIDQLISLGGKLDEPELVREGAHKLVELASSPRYAEEIWTIAVILAREKTHGDLPERLIRSIGKAPSSLRNVRAFFKYALYDQQFDYAVEMYRRIPQARRLSHAAIDYVRIINRLGRFDEARDASYAITAHYNANIRSFSPYTSFALLRRVGELKFAAETAEYYNSEEQPQQPEGVILVTARNMDQLRRLPIAVLIELKKRGWAIVPIIEGILPIQSCGVPEIDALAGALTMDRTLRKKSDQPLKPVETMAFEPDKGRLRWGEIELSHAVWEDASINRRRYHVDFSCPALQAYLQQLVTWTRLEASVLEYIADLRRRTGLKCGMFGFSTGRLPDAAKRSFCDLYGDPNELFSLTAANGYQNYFSNFSTPVSTKSVVRNMTRYPYMRSASFPIPELLSNYYEKHRESAPDVLERVKGVTQIKRSTVGRDAPSEATIEIDRRISAWRAKGGNVACAFGKVVCDSAVPFDGGPAHESMEDWINNCVSTVQGSDTLLLIKPHPHEINNQIATFPTEYFHDLVHEPLGENCLFLEHHSFDIHDLNGRIDFGLIYNGTTAVELGVLDIPCILAGHFAPLDYAVGHQVPRDRAHFESMLRGEVEIVVADDLKYRSALWLQYMSDAGLTVPYGYCARPVTNKVIYPPTWIESDISRYLREGDPNVEALANRVLGEALEPG